MRARRSRRHAAIFKAVETVKVLARHLNGGVWFVETERAVSKLAGSLGEVS
jgi:hypothetical protein